jgi:hypothetical protein
MHHRSGALEMLKCQMLRGSQIDSKESLISIFKKRIAVYYYLNKTNPMKINHFALEHTLSERVRLLAKKNELNDNNVITDATIIT